MSLLLFLLLNMFETILVLTLYPRKVSASKAILRVWPKNQRGISHPRDVQIFGWKFRPKIKGGNQPVISTRALTIGGKMSTHFLNANNADTDGKQVRSKKCRLSFCGSSRPPPAPPLHHADVD